MSTSKKFKKKLRNFRQGMSAWRVHGYPIRNENYESWGKDQDDLDRNHGKGNTAFMQDGTGYFFITVERICNIPLRTCWGWMNSFSGKRKLQYGCGIGMGSLGGKYFNNPEKAREFMQDVINGHYPQLVNAETEYHSELDALDACFDSRDDFQDEDYPYSENEFY